MEINFELLSQNELFYGISQDEIARILHCTSAKSASFSKGEYIMREGDLVSHLGIVMSGACLAFRTDFSGRRLVMSRFDCGGIFGDVLSSSVTHKSPVTIEATEPCAVLLISYDAIINRCSKSCAGHNALLRNLLCIISGKYFALHDRISCLVKPTLREKILAFLSDFSMQSGGKTFSVPFDRLAFADYLNADRSALCRELSAMKRDGILDYYKNSFKLL